MAVIIGSARIDERGRITGGQAGDQTGKEVTTQNWYLDSRGWVLIRAKDKLVADRIAWDMKIACENNNIGYDQSNNQSLYYAVAPYGWDCSKVNYPVETDCSQLVRVCTSYALGYSVPYFYTGDEVEVLESTNAFDIIKDAKYTRSSDYLKKGDILVTPVKGHTVVVLTDGPKAYDRAVDEDGVWGRKTSYYSQILLGTYADGEIWNQKSSCKRYLKACSTDSWKFKLFPSSNSAFVCKLQELIGAKVTGYMDKDSVKALQTFLRNGGYYKDGENSSSDGYLGADTARAWQRYVNANL